MALVIGEFAGALFPALAGRSVSVAAVIAVTFAILQWRGVLWGSNVQNVTSLLKALAFVALIIAAFTLGGGATETAAEPKLTSDKLVLIGAFVLSLQAVIYTYDGWTGVVYFSEEVEDPSRNIPRSLFGGVLLVIAIYLLVNLALLHVLPISKIAGQAFAAGAAATVILAATGTQSFEL